MAMMNRDHLARPPSPASPSSEISHESEQDKLDEVQPVTRHDIDTLIMAVDFIDKKIEQLKKQTIYHDKRFEEDVLTIHSLINSNDQYNKTNIRELIQKDKETQSHLGNLAINQSHDNTRANNLEMKLRKRGYLSKFHAIDYVPFIKLPDKSKYGGTRTTITNKYIVS